MTTTDPLSLTEAKRLAPNADTILLRATRPADLETPIGAFLRLDDGGARLPPRVRRGRRAARPVLVPRRRARAGCSRFATVRPGFRPGPSPSASTRRTCRSDTVDAPDPLDAIRSFVPRRRVQPTEGMPRFTGGAVGALAYDAVVDLRADRAAPRARPGRRPDGRLHRDRPRPRLRPPDPHALGDRVAPHRSARLRGPLPDRRGGDLRGARADGPAERRRDGRRGRRAPRPPRASREDRIETSLGRDEYVHAVEVAKDAIAAGEAIQVVLARRQSFDLPVDPATGAPLDGIGLYRVAPPRQPQPVPVLRPDAVVRGRRREPGAAAPGRGRQAHDPPDRRHAAAWRGRARRTRSSPSSSSATRRSERST